MKKIEPLGHWGETKSSEVNNKINEIIDVVNELSKIVGEDTQSYLQSLEVTTTTTPHFKVEDMQLWSFYDSEVHHLIFETKEKAEQARDYLLGLNKEEKRRVPKEKSLSEKFREVHGRSPSGRELAAMM